MGKIGTIRKAICVSMITVVSLCGCGEGKGENSVSDTPISVYLAEGSSFLDIIESYNGQISDEGNKVEYTLFPAEDSENMYKKMTNELLAGDGPDLFFFDSSNTVRIEQLADQGAFLPIEGMKAPEMISDDVERGIVPVSYQIPLLFTTEDICRKYGIDTGQTVLTERDLDMLSENEIPVFSDPYDLLDFIYENYIDWEKKESHFGENGFGDIVEAVAGWNSVATDRDMVYYGINMKEFTWIARGELMFCTTSSNSSPMQMVTLYNLLRSKLGEELVFFGIADEGGGLKAYADEIVAVNANSDNQKAAVDFVEYLLSGEVQSCTEEGFRKISGIPVLESAREDETAMMTSVPYKENYTDITAGVPDTFREKYASLLAEAKTVVIRDNLYKQNIFDTSLDSYKAGRINIDAMTDELDKKTKLYLKE